MKYIKRYEKIIDGEDVKLSYYNFNDIFKFITKLITKFGINEINGDKISGEGQGAILISDNYFKYILPSDETIYKYIKNFVNKYYMTVTSDEIRFEFYIHNNNILYLNKPVEEYDKKRRRNINRFFTKNKYNVITFGGDIYSSDDIKSGQKFLDDIEMWLETSFEYMFWKHKIDIENYNL